MYLNLPQIEDKVVSLAKTIKAPKDTFPTFGQSDHSGRPHVEVDSNGYHYVVAERGEEFQRHTTSDLDQLLYYVFQDITFDLACKYALARQIPWRDFRRKMFSRQEELLSKLYPAWGERRKREHEQILKQHPFDDFANLRAIFSRKR